MRKGSLGVAIVARQVIVFQVARSYTRRDRFLDVSTFAPFGTNRVFLATDAPKARIKTSDILSVFPVEDIDRTRSVTPGMLELPDEAVAEFYLLSARQQDRYEKLWNAWANASI
ncbi:hypothetical protein C8F01DRAFT_1178627 [Mycena amicta]|nr:hypothetical protein C8F01DRAFT_1178627 [Mycena amicta]